MGTEGYNFDAFDKDKDGELSEDELTKAFEEFFINSITFYANAV